MKKIKKLMKKMASAIVVYFLAMPTSFARVEYLYGPMPDKLLKEEPPEPIKPSFPKTLVIVPIVFVLGIIVYLLKSKSNKKRKIITAVIALILATLICFGIYNYYYNPDFK